MLVAQTLKSLPAMRETRFAPWAGNPLQYSCLENRMDGGAWKATIHGVAKSWRLLRDFTSMLWMAKHYATTSEADTVLKDPIIPLEESESVSHSVMTLCDSMDCGLPGSSVLEILQGRILEWVAIPFSMGYSWPRDWTGVSCIGGRYFIIWATWRALENRIAAMFVGSYHLYLAR